MPALLVACILGALLVDAVGRLRGSRAGMDRVSVVDPTVIVTTLRGPRRLTRRDLAH
jgi:hypothetical protein